MKQLAASLKIQTNLRRYIARKSYRNQKSMAITVQTGMRAMAGRKEFRYRKQNKASIIIQAHWRGHQASSYYNKLSRESIVTQCRWRGRLGRRELRKLKMAARETGALKDAKDKLEKQVEDLTLSLQLERRLRSDSDDAKSREISKLQHSLQVLQKKLDETNALLVKERESSQKAIEEASSIVKETPVPGEVDNLKTALELEKQRADDSENVGQKQ